MRASDSTRIVVMGLGYVGESIAALSHQCGHRVTGLDLDAARVEALRDRPWSSTVTPLVLQDTELVLVCVPTPLDRARRPDREALGRAATLIREHAPRDVRVCLESTVDPDYAATGFAAAAGLSLDHVAHAPERIEPGQNRAPTQVVPRVVGGCSEAATEWAASFYRSLGIEVYKTTAEIAALSKLLENTQRLVNIALAGEFAAICQARGINIDHVAEAAATKPFGYQDFRARAGAGGHCVPVDPVWLVDSAASAGVALPTVAAALSANTRRPLQVAETLLREAPEASNILLIGAAYKPEVTDTRESPCRIVANRLATQGRHVRVCDPLTNGLRGYPSVDLDDDTLAWADAILVLVGHSTIPFGRLEGYSGPVFDASGDLRGRFGRRL